MNKASLSHWARGGFMLLAPFYRASSSGRCICGCALGLVFRKSFFFLSQAALRFSYSSRCRSRKLSAMMRGYD